MLHRGKDVDAVRGNLRIIATDHRHGYIRVQANTGCGAAEGLAAQVFECGPGKPWVGGCFIPQGLQLLWRKRDTTQTSEALPHDVQGSIQHRKKINQGAVDVEADDTRGFEVHGSGCGYGWRGLLSDVTQGCKNGASKLALTGEATLRLLSSRGKASFDAPLMLENGQGKPCTSKTGGIGECLPQPRHNAPE